MSYLRFQVYESSPITAMRAIPDTKVVVTAGGHGSPVLLNFLGQESELQSIELPTDKVGVTHAVDVANLRKIVASATGNLVSLHDVSKGAMIRQFHNTVLRGTECDVGPVGKAQETILDARFIDENVMVTCGVNHHLAFFDCRVKRQLPIATINAGNDNLNSLAIDSQNPALVSAGSSSGLIHMLDLRNQVLVYDKVSSHPVLGIADAPGKNCLARLGDKSIMVIDQEQALLLDTVRIDGKRPTSSKIRYNVEYEPRSDHIIYGTEEGTVQIWHWDSRNSKASYTRTLRIESISGDSRVVNFLTTTKSLSHMDTIIASNGDGSIHSWSSVF